MEGETRRQRHWLYTDKQQRIAAAKRKVRHDVNVTDCTLTIGDVVYIRVRTWRGKFQEIWSPIVHVVICVQYVGSNVYVVRPATGGPKKTVNRASLLLAYPPAKEVDDYAAQEDSLSDDEAVLLVPEIATAADLRIRRASSKRCQHWTSVPPGGGDVANDVIITRCSTRTTTWVPPDRFWVCGNVIGLNRCGWLSETRLDTGVSTVIRTPCGSITWEIIIIIIINKFIYTELDSHTQWYIQAE